MDPKRLAGSGAYVAGRVVAVVRQYGPGVSGPVVVVAGVAQWSRPAATIVAGVALLAYDIARGMQERAASRPARDETMVEGGPR